MLCLTLVIPVLVLAGVLASFYVASQHAYLDRTGLDAARGAAYAIDRELTGLVFAAEVLAKSHAARSGDWAELDIRAREFRQEFGADIEFHDRTGRRQVDTARPHGAALPAPVPPPRATATLPADRPQVSDLVSDPATAAATIRIDVPDRAEPETIGLLRLVLAPDLVRGIIQDLPAPPGWTITIADRQGIVVAQSGEQPGAPRQSLAAALTRAAARVREGNADDTGAHMDGDSVIAAFSHSHLSGWTAWATAPEAEITTALRRSAASVAALGVLLALLSSALAVLFARRIAHPVMALARAAERLREGQAIPPPATGIAELAQVGHALAAATAERLAAEAGLRDSEARFRALFGAVPVAVAVFDPGTLGFVAFNDRACDTLGYDRATFAALHVPDIEATQSEDEVRRWAASLDAEGAPQEFTTQYRDRGDRIRDVLARATRVLLNGRALAYVAWLDVTEQHAQTRALQQMMQRQTAILEALPANVALLDAQGVIVTVNAAWRRFAMAGGLEPDSRTCVGADYLAACRPAAAGDPAARAALDGLRDILARRRDHLELTYPCDLPDGTPRWFHMVAGPDTDAGAAGGAVVMHLDITERIRAEHALADSEARQRLFIERVPAAIAVFDAGMRYLSLSRRFLTDYGLPDRDPEAFAGRSHYDVFPDLPEHWRAIHRRVLDDGETLSAEDEEFLRADGRTDWVRWQMTPWRQQDGSIGGAVLFSEVVTARKAAEAALRASEARLRLAIEATGLGTFDTELRTGVTRWNDTSFRIFGLEPSDAPIDVSAWRSRIHADDQRKVEEAFQAALASDGLYQCEHRIARTDGEIRWIRPLGRVLRDDDGTAVRMVGVFSDITLLKRANENQERLLQLIEQSNDFIAIANQNGQVSYLNRGGRRMIGLHETARLGRLNLMDYVAPASLDRFNTEIMPIVSVQGLWEGEIQYVNQRSGAPVDVRCTLFPLRDAAGRLNGYATVTRDITAAKRAAEALDEREARLRSILETVPDGMVLIDEQGVMLSFSATAERMFGWPAAEAVGRNVNVLMPSPDHEAHDEYIAHYLATGERHIIGIGRIVTGRRRDGSTFPLDLSIGELGVDGRRLFTGFMRDLTERQATQARLQELQAEAAHVARLSAAGAMASALAHELNQPLTATTSAVRAARRMLATAGLANTPPALAEAMDLAAEQALRAGHIIQRLREFVSRGGEPADRRLEALPKLIEDASALALIGAREMGLHVTFRIAPGLPLVLADRVQIQQVLVNLIRNAAQAMAERPADSAGPAPRRDVTVSAVPADPGATPGAEPGTVEISVADTGPGLAPEVADRLFEPFVTTRSGGMGVGLSISRSIVEAHGGRLWAEPNPGGGTIFRFTLHTAQFNPPRTKEGRQ
ncbi:PAS domain S-box protein [Rhodopila globiformis]|nr:PAS domain S-box protein [Rhodopila globiformis]